MELFFRILDKLIFLYQMLIFARVILSWLPLNREHSLVQFILTVTEPILKPIRLLINKSIFGGKGQVLDFSPFFAYLFLAVVQGIIPN